MHALSRRILILALFSACAPATANPAADEWIYANKYANKYAHKYANEEERGEESTESPEQPPLPPRNR
ncbi:MAG: hypothetical protein LBP86_08395 [Azoarcus sp.]|jgi:hypothetical protein|nr:hypothetical protein [Azoarcus sp.]